MKTSFIRQILPFILHTVCILMITVFIESCKKDTINIQLTPLSSGTSHQLHSVFFINNDTGYVSGGTRYTDGIILKTTNGGKSWSVKRVSDKIVFDIRFISKNIGFGVGLDGKIYRTIDGGNNWIIYQTKYWKYLHDIFFINDKIGYTVGGLGYSDGVIYKTTDGGLTWEDGDTLDVELRSVFFIGVETGFYCGYGLIRKTIDGGVTWNNTSATGDFFTSIFFTSNLIGYAVGIGGTILKTYDAGQTWETQRNGNNSFQKKISLESVAFISNLIGFAVGRNGIVLKTIDGGDNWMEIKCRKDIHFFDIYPFDSKSGIIVGDKGAIYKYIN